MTIHVKDFLKENPLLVRIPTDRVVTFRKILIVANESYVLRWNEDDDGFGVIFSIVCPRTNWAEAYFHLGQLSGRVWVDQLDPKIIDKIKM